MKNATAYLLIVFTFVLEYSSVYAQRMHDYKWLLGYGDNNPEAMYGGCEIDFLEVPLKLEFFEVPTYLFDISILSDKHGSLQVYSEGCSVYNRNHTVIPNGDSINYGTVWNTYCATGYPRTQGILILPYPGDESKAMIFHQRINDGFTGMRIQYSLLDLSMDENLGVVIEKDKLLNDLPLGDYITATQHANGLDWWVLTPETGTNRFFVYLLSASGVSDAMIQSIGEPWGPKYWSGQISFSPHGSSLARVDPNNGLYLYDFDRCSGILSNQRHFEPFLEHVSGAAGVAFSADSRFLYVTYLTKIFQLDLWDSDILSSMVVVAEYDGFRPRFLQLSIRQL